MPRSRPEAFELMVEAEKSSKCIRFLRFLWKFFRCVFSHVSLVSLVVLYCLIGAYAFEALEATHEKEVDISNFNSLVSLILVYETDGTTNKPRIAKESRSSNRYHLFS